MKKRTQFFGQALGQSLLPENVNRGITDTKKPAIMLDTMHNGLLET